MYQSVWQNCLQALQAELPAQHFSMSIRPLQADSSADTLTLYAPNRFVLDWVREKYLNRILELIRDYCGDNAPRLRFDVGSSQQAATSSPSPQISPRPAQVAAVAPEVPEPAPKTIFRSNVRANYTLLILLKVNRTS
ncbi:chromosomal replication initiator protein DnaA [Alishewanella longhuensis]